MKKFFFLLSLFLSLSALGQQNPIFERLTAIANGGTIYYNIDGYSISKETLNYPFTEKGLKKIYRKYKVKKDDPKINYQGLSNKNVYAWNDDELANGIIQNNSFYFIENEKKRVDIIRFSAINKRDKVFEHEFVQLILNDEIPKSNFSPTSTTQVNFAGRTLELGGVCSWMDVNSIQCPQYGQMNWSVYQDLEIAKNNVNYQLEITRAKKGGKIISEEQIDIVFEGIEVEAKKVVLDFKGIKSLLASMSGGETLTIYYVAAPVRGNYVGCVLSHWNNDKIEENGLPLLLNEVMKIK